MGPLRFRPAAGNDYAAFTHFFAELEVPDPVPEHERWTEHMLPTTGFLELDGAVVGYAFWELQPPVGYVRHVVIAREHRGRGLGAALMLALKRELSGRDCTSWCLNVKAANTSARRLYGNMGMSDRYTSSVLRLPWACISALPSAASMVAREAPVGDDADLEQRFGLPARTLETRRRQPATIVVSAANGAEPERGGLAVFDPNFPGAFPFRADSPSAARALLELLEQHRRPEHTEVQLVIEDDPVLYTALAEAGARHLFDVVHMQGEIGRALDTASES
ncbi:MAG TPA: GNAT family N-acetyltransferase [Polyangiaceae bacterium]|nr:GNAT family N-acetyltransferase [Polyangiaceae bacterium]